MASRKSTGPTSPTPGLDPVDMVGMRSHNLGLVLRHIRTHQPCSRSQVAAATGLTRPGVAKLVAELLRLQLVAESEPVMTHHTGRPSTQLRLAGAHLAGVGVEIRSGHVAVLVRDLAGRELAKARRRLPPQPTVRRVVRLVASLLDTVTAQTSARVVGVGIAVAALVDSARGYVVDSPVFGWRDVELRDLILEEAGGDRYGPVVIDDVANLAALAVSRTAPYQSVGQLLHLEVGTGLGVGSVSRGRLQTGAHGFAGAIGHVPVAADGGVCTCGRRGCLDVVAGFRALVAASGEVATDDTGRERAPADVMAGITARAERGDRLALAAIDQVGRWTGRAVAMLVNILDPDVVTVGGYLLDLRPWVTAPLMAEVHAHVIAPQLGGCEVTMAPLGQTAALVGAGGIAFDPIFEIPGVVG